VEANRARWARLSADGQQGYDGDEPATFGVTGRLSLMKSKTVPIFAAQVSPQVFVGIQVPQPLNSLSL